ncbi:hypothetical protein J4450_03180 [Candidatus Micrarchaeota archaeon]|nr:hypothetical protein [Candidatus Micrarchaeota archaeon]
MVKSIVFLKEELRRKMRQYGLSEEKIEDVSRTFEKNNHHIDTISFVILLERFGLDRRSITEFLKDVGIDDITIINIFGKVDLKKTEMSGSREISNIILEE